MLYRLSLPACETTKERTLGLVICSGVVKVMKLSDVISGWSSIVSSLRADVELGATVFLIDWVSGRDAGLQEFY